MSVVTYEEAVTLKLKPDMEAGQLWYKIRYPNGLFRGPVLCVVRADLTLSPLDDGPYPDGDAVYAPRIGEINTEPFDFSAALRCLKDRHKMTRKGWDTSTYITLQSGYPDGININKNTAEATGMPEGTNCCFMPYILLKTGQEKPTFTPWVASQEDILSNDWVFFI
jgi:hypothetical protein